PGVEGDRVRAHLLAKQVEHRDVSAVAHFILVRRASKRRASSSRPTARPRQASTPHVKCADERATVAGAAVSSAAGKRYTCSTSSTGKTQLSPSRLTTSNRAGVAAGSAAMPRSPERRAH